MKKINDVIICGAGPSGAMASLVLSKKGIDVLMIEKKEKPGVPVQCGEGISEYALRSVGIKEEFFIEKRMKGVKIFTLGSENFLKISVPGFLIKRDLFDRYLCDTAIEKGAKLKLKERVIKVEKRGDLFEVETNRNRYYAKFFVLSGGVSHSIKGVKKPEKVVKAIEFRFKLKKELEDEYFWFFMGEPFNPFYGWIFSHTQTLGIGCGIEKSTIPLQKLCEKFNINIKEKKRIVAGKIPFYYPFDKESKEYIIKTGDSVASIHPFTAGGIHGALITGKIAGEKISKNFENYYYALKSYYSEIKKLPLFRKDIWRYKDILFSKSRKDFELILEIMNKREYKNIYWKKFLKKLVRKPLLFSALWFFLNIRYKIEETQNYLY